MTKVTLKNGTVYEFDTPKEATQFEHMLHWREYQGQTVNPQVMIIGKGSTARLSNCKICKEPLPKSKHNNCGKTECKKEAKKRYQRAWYKKHPKYNQTRKQVPITHVEPQLA